MPVAKNNSFAKIMKSTLAMLRHSLKARACYFYLLNDKQGLELRSGDGAGRVNGFGKSLHKAQEEPFRHSMMKNRIHEHLSKDGKSKTLLVPVAGEKRCLGLLILGPFPARQNLKNHDGELRSAGALCAILSANWRMYEWMSSFLPQLNHELRTPLTAVQGSIGMVLGGMFGPVGGEVKEMLTMAQKGCERTVHAIEEYLNTKKLG